MNFYNGAHTLVGSSSVNSLIQNLPQKAMPWNHLYQKKIKARQMLVFPLSLTGHMGICGNGDTAACFSLHYNDVTDACR